MSIHIVSAAIIRRTEGEGARVLLAQRSHNTSFPYYWCTPGGKVNPDESQAAALRRELSEELVVDLHESWAPVVAYDVTIGPPVVRSAMRMTCFLIDAGLVLGKPVPSDKTDGVGWFSAQEVFGMRLAPCDVEGRGKLIRLMAG